MRSVRVAFAFLLLGAATAHAQPYVISTYAGGVPPSAPAAAFDVSIATDSAGNAYFTSMNSVFKLDAKGAFTRVAGNSRAGFSGDGGPATSAQLDYALGVAVDGEGNLFIADAANYRVRRVSRDGIISTVAGNGTPGFDGDGGPATSARLSYPQSVAVDGAGNLFIADSLGLGFYDSGNRIRRVSADGIITTVAGNGACCYFSGDGGPATQTQLTGPNRLAIDGAGNLYITEPLSGRVRKVSPDGIITSVAGSRKGMQFGESCAAGSSGNGGPATGAPLCLPYGVAVDRTGNLFIAEYGYRCCYDIDDPVIENFAVRQVSPDGTITTVPASVTPGITVCNCADVGSGFVAVDSAGSVFLSDSILIRKISPDGSVVTIADQASACCFSGDGGPATSAELYYPTAVALDAEGNLFISDVGNYRIRKVSPDGNIATVAGTDPYGYSGDGGPATNAQLWDVTGLAVDAAGNLFLADRLNNRIRKVSPDGTITTVAGGGMDFPVNGGAATNALLSNPTAVGVDGAGNLFIATSSTFSRSLILKISPSGIVTVVAGGGKTYPEDGGPATSAGLQSPQALAVDGAGNLFIADGGRIRKVSLDGIITTVAGGGNDLPGDGGPATSAQLQYPQGLAVDSAGNLFLADTGRVRKISAGGIITTVAGIGNCCTSFGDDGPATSAQLSPRGVAVDNSGNVYVVDWAANAVRILRPATAAPGKSQ